MPTGTVKFYNKKNKFGFIKVDETNEEVYTRQSVLLDEIKEEDRVEFELEAGRKGPTAVNVKLIPSPESEA